MSGKEIGDIFNSSIIDGLLKGLDLFLKSGGWYIIGIAVLGVLFGLTRRKFRRY